MEFRTLNWHNFSSLPQSTESNLAKCASAKDNTVHWRVLCPVYLQCCQSGIKIHKVHLYRRSLGHPNCITNTRWFHHFINDLCRRWIWKTIWMIRSCLKMEKKYFWWVKLLNQSHFLTISTSRPRASSRRTRSPRPCLRPRPQPPSPRFHKIRMWNVTLSVMMATSQGDGYKCRNLDIVLLAM